MSKELKEITSNVMGQIHQGKVKMRPKVYFVMGSLLTFLGLVFFFTTSVFLVGLLRFSIRPHGPMKEVRFGQLVDSFSWWIPVFAIISLVVGFWLLRRYEISYKKNYTLIVIWIVVAVIATGFFVDSIGLNDNLMRRGRIGAVNNHGPVFKHQ